MKTKKRTKTNKNKILPYNLSNHAILPGFIKKMQDASKCKQSLHCRLAGYKANKQRKKHLSGRVCRICTGFKLTFYFLPFATMKTKIFDNGDYKSCYIDKNEFYKLVDKGALKIEKEYPNPDIKLANGVDYKLINSDKDWEITIYKNNSFGCNYKYQVRSNLSRFPTEIITTGHKKMIIGGNIRYRGVYSGDIDWTEYGGSCSMYTNELNGPRREMIEKNGFKIIDKHEQTQD